MKKQAHTHQNAKQRNLLNKQTETTKPVSVICNFRLHSIAFDFLRKKTCQIAELMLYQLDTGVVRMLGDLDDVPTQILLLCILTGTYFLKVS